MTDLIEKADGSKEWYKDGQRHREGGAAIDYQRKIFGFIVEFRDDGARFVFNAWDELVLTVYPCGHKTTFGVGVYK